MADEELKDIQIVCKDCGKTFVHEVRDQIFYKQMGYENTPKACADCRRAKKEARNRTNGNRVVDFNSKRNNDQKWDQAA